jgi:SAM-dependent methyltransferase
MTIGCGAAAQAMTQLADIRPGDRVVDVGCGPGTMVRAVAHRGATVTGIDPSQVALRLEPWISRLRGMSGLAWLYRCAETIPVSDRAAAIVWAHSSVLHWTNRAAGVSEICRVLEPAGRVLLAERLTQQGARGRAHGLTTSQADQLAGQLADVGFINIHTQTHQADAEPLSSAAPGQPHPERRLRAAPAARSQRPRSLPSQNRSFSRHATLRRAVVVAVRQDGDTFVAELAREDGTIFWPNYAHGPNEVLAVPAAEQRFLVGDQASGAVSGATYVDKTRERLARWQTAR